jgi:predicted DNA-binding protein (MmcQ/YjbR family)
MNFCLNLKSVKEDFPFDKQTLVFKVHGKMFALCDIEDFKSINLKCDPEKAIDLRERYAGIRPGWHMNKTHWNTVSVDEDVSWDLIFELTKHSYELVYATLPKKITQID